MNDFKTRVLGLPKSERRVAVLCDQDPAFAERIARDLFELDVETLSNGPERDELAGHWDVVIWSGRGPSAPVGIPIVQVGLTSVQQVSVPDDVRRLARMPLSTKDLWEALALVLCKETKIDVPSVVPTIMGVSAPFLAAVNTARRVARSNARVFITGESGTGKEVLAQYIHGISDRAKGPFVAINCSAIPENLIESELFGHAKGSFTGANEKRTGLFEEAQDGTLLLDEIGDLSLPMQAKILRVLQEKKVRRIGENIHRPINCRIISATHKNLLEEVRLGKFREDLFYRLDVVPISIPPLRERPEDILPLAELFLRRYSAENRCTARRFSKTAEHYIRKNSWKGNVRELENAVERAVILSDSIEISGDDFVSIDSPAGLDDRKDPILLSGNSFVLKYGEHLPSLDEVIHRYVEFAVECRGGAKDRTAKEIGVDRKTLYKHLRSKFGAYHFNPSGI